MGTVEGFLLVDLLVDGEDSFVELKPWMEMWVTYFNKSKTFILFDFGFSSLFYAWNQFFPWLELVSIGVKQRQLD